MGLSEIAMPIAMVHSSWQLVFVSFVGAAFLCLSAGLTVWASGKYTGITHIMMFLVIVAPFGSFYLYFQGEARPIQTVEQLTESQGEYCRAPIFRMAIREFKSEIPFEVNEVIRLSEDICHSKSLITTVAKKRKVYCSDDLTHQSCLFSLATKAHRAHPLSVFEISLLHQMGSSLDEKSELSQVGEILEKVERTLFVLETLPRALKNNDDLEYRLKKTVPDLYPNLIGKLDKAVDLLTQENFSWDRLGTQKKIVKLRNRVAYTSTAMADYLEGAHGLSAAQWGCRMQYSSACYKAAVQMHNQGQWQGAKPYYQFACRYGDKKACGYSGKPSRTIASTPKK